MCLVRMKAGILLHKILSLCFHGHTLYFCAYLHAYLQTSGTVDRTSTSCEYAANPVKW
jgi:hypothetical protein